MSGLLQEDQAMPVRGETTVATDYAVVTAAGLGSALLSFVSAMLTTRLLAPAAFGALSLLFLVSLVLQTATSAWTSLAATRFGREALDLSGSMAAVTRARATLVAPWFVVACLGAIVLKAAGALPAQLTWVLTGLALLHGTVTVVYEHCVNLLRSLGRQRLSALAIVLQQIVLLVVISVLLAAGADATPAAIAVLYAAGSAALVAIYVPMLRSVGFGGLSRDRALERRMWTFSRPLIGLAVGTYVVGSIDLWVLSAFAGARAVGTYAAAYRSYAVLMTVAAAASPVLMTLFVSLRLAGRSTDIRRYVERVVPALVLLAGAVAAIAVAPAYLLMPVVFGHAFAGGSLPLAILLIAVVAYLQLSLLATVLGSHDRTFETARVFLAAALVNVVGDLIAVGLLGAGSWAPATATVAFALLVAAGYLRVAGECTGARVRFPFAAYVPPALAVSALVLVPEASRVVASLAVGALASIIALAVHARTLGVDAELLAKLPSTELWSRALAGVRGRP